MADLAGTVMLAQQVKNCIDDDAKQKNRHELYGQFIQSAVG